MAFSTQKDFYLISDLCQRPAEKTSAEVKCPPALKSYLSCTDYRAWSLSKEDQSRYLLDFISRDMRLRDEGSSGDATNQTSSRQPVDRPHRIRTPTESYRQTASVAARTDYDANEPVFTGGIIEDSAEYSAMAPKDSHRSVSSGESNVKQKAIESRHSESSSIIPIYENVEVISVDESTNANREHASTTRSDTGSRGHQEAMAYNEKSSALNLTNRKSFKNVDMHPPENPRHGSAINPANESISIISLTGESLPDIQPASIINISSSINGLGRTTPAGGQISSGKISENEMIDLTGETESREVRANRRSADTSPSGDSLIEAACLKLTEINAIVRENQNLRRQLHYSTERLQSLHVENTRIRAIVSDSQLGHIGPLKEELDLLQARGDFSPESVMRAIQMYTQDIKMQGRQIDIIEAENDSLKQQLALLEARLHAPVIPAEVELSTDVSYLQSTVNDLRNEALQHRAIEEQYARIRVEFDKLKHCVAAIGGPQELSGLIKTSAQFGEIKCDRDRLRHLISSMVGIEDDLRSLRERAERADHLEQRLANLKARSGEMGDISDASREKMNDEIERMRREKDEIQQKLNCAMNAESEMRDLENQLCDYERVRLELNLYKIHYNELMNEMRRVCTKLLQLEPELDQTRQRLSAAETTICSYEHEIDELMELICELNDENKTLTIKTKSQDSQTQDLIDVSKNVAIHIEKEFVARQRLQNELDSCRFEIVKLRQTGVVAQRQENIDQMDSGHSLADCKCDSDCVCNGNFAIELTISVDSSDSGSSGTDIAPLEPCETSVRQDSAVKSSDELNSLRAELEAVQKQLLELQKENEELDNQIRIARDLVNAPKNDNLSEGMTKEDSYEIHARALETQINPTCSDEVLEEPSRSEEMLTEYSKLKSRIEELESLLEISNKNNEGKIKELNARQSHITELEHQVAKLTRDMKESMDKCAKEIEQFRANKSASHDKLEEENGMKPSQTDLVKLQDELTIQTINCQTEKEDMQAQMNKIIQEAEEEIGKLKLQIEALQKKHVNVDAPTGNEYEVDPIIKELEDQITEYENTKADLIKQLEESNEKVENLNRLIEQYTHEREDCEKAQIAIEEELTEKYDHLERNYDSLHQQNANLEQALEDLHKDYESKALEWSKELNEYKSLLEQAKTSLETRRSENSKLREILNEESSEDFGKPLAQLAAENSKLQAENETLKDTIQLNEKQIASLQDKLLSINTSAEETPNSADCSEYINEIEELKASVALHWDDMRKQSNLLDDLKKEVDEVRAEKSRLEDELSKAKVDKDATNLALKEHIAELETDLAEAKNSQSNNGECRDNVKRLQVENENLLKENEQLRGDLKLLEDIVSDIEDESRKYEKLGVMIENFEQTSRDFESTPTLPADSIPSLTDNLSQQLKADSQPNNSQTDELETCKKSLSNVQEKFKNCQKELELAQATIGQLKLRELELEKLKVSGQKLQTELNRCQEDLRKIKISNRKLPRNDTLLPRTSSKDSPAMDSYVHSSVQDEADTFAKKSLSESAGPFSVTWSAHKTSHTTSDLLATTISEMKATHSEDLEKIRSQYEERIRELVKNHAEEIRLLQLTMGSLKAKLAGEAQIDRSDANKLEQVSEALESDTNICDYDKRLNKICTKIIRSTINCLALKELKYLHCAVYRAGVKIKPNAASYYSEEIRRCCECTGFVCCLPCIPKDEERKFMERINCLEGELENANHVLQQLRDSLPLKSNCSRRCCTMYSERRTVPTHGINEAVNQILKCARQEKTKTAF